jgi:hypothetical protein
MSSCHTRMECFHGKVKEAGRFTPFRCDDCEALAESLGCRRSFESYLFPTDPDTDESRWWVRYTKHVHVADPLVKDRNVCTLCYEQNWEDASEGLD